MLKSSKNWAWVKDFGEHLGVYTMPMPVRNRMPVIYFDDLSYETDPAGQNDPGGGLSMMIFGEDAPARFKQYFEYEWEGHAGAWERMIELTQANLDREPDNPCAQEKAWLLGLHPDGGAFVAQKRQKLAEWTARDRAEWNTYYAEVVQC